MEFVQFILYMLLSLPPAYADTETWDERQARMTIVATAIDDASSQMTCTGKYAPTEKAPCKVRWTRSKRELAVLLVTKGWWESRFAQNVHEGNCKSYECDAEKQKDGTVIHRARSSWQIQQTGIVKGTEWEDMKGASQAATTTAATVAARALSYAHNRCKTVYGAISGYGVASCTWSGVANRYRWYGKMMEKKPEALKVEAKKREATAREKESASGSSS